MNTLILPKHVAERRIKQVQKEKKVKKKPLEEMSLPKPTGWRILVLPYKAKEKTKGGIILSDKNFEEIINYLKKRNAVELEKISGGKNPEVEKRYDRYVDYG